MSFGSLQSEGILDTKVGDGLYRLSRKPRIRIWIPLAFIMSLGLVVRLYGLTAYGVWFDEAYHIQLVQLPDVPTMLDAVLSNPPSAPLYVLLLRGWTGIFGYDDQSARMLSVLFGTLTLPATYWLGRVMASHTVGLVGALMLAVSPYAVEFSQEAALYALASLTTTLALAAGWRGRGSGSGLAIYVILGTVAIYSHYVVAVILGLFTLFGLYRRISSAISRRSWLIANGTIFLLWTPWLIAMLIHWTTSPQPRATLSHTATIDEIVGALVHFSSGSAALLQDQVFLEALGLLSGATLFFAGCLAAWKGKRYDLVLIAVISALVFLLPAIASAITGRWLFVPHFMLFLLPALLVVLANGSTWQPTSKQSPAPQSVSLSPKTRYLLPALLVPWLAAQIWGLAIFYRYPPHGVDGLRELTSVLRASVRPNEPVFVTPPVLTPTLRQYYSGEVRGLPVDFDLRIIYRPYDADDWYRQSIAALDAEATGRERFWLVYRPELDQDGKFLTHVTNNYRIVDQHSYIYADLYLVERP